MQTRSPSSPASTATTSNRTACGPRRSTSARSTTSSASLELASEPAGSATEPEHSLPGPLDDLLLAIRTPAGKRELRRLLGSALLDHPVLVDPATAARMARPYRWLLDRVGDNGIKLTSAGYL